MPEFLYKKEKQYTKHCSSIITHLKEKESSPFPISNCHNHKKYKITYYTFIPSFSDRIISNLHPGKSSLSIYKQYTHLCTLQCHYHAHGYSSNSFITCKMLYFSITTSLPCIFSVRKSFQFLHLFHMD